MNNLSGFFMHDRGASVRRWSFTLS